jgi:hypothetical protein
MWTELVNTDDISNLKNLYGEFHDSCLREFYVSTKEFVDDKGAMSFSNELTATLLFQRQSKTNRVLELKFSGLKHLNYQPLSDENVIYDATLKLEDGIFYWADFEGWTLSDYQSGDKDSFWLCSSRLFWRLRPELIGNINRLSE